MAASASHYHSDPIEIHLVRGDDENGDAAYWYLAIKKSMVQDLFVSLKVKTTELERYGVILASGFGEPDAETQYNIRSLLKNA